MLALIKRFPKLKFEDRANHLARDPVIIFIIIFNGINMVHRSPFFSFKSITVRYKTLEGENFGKMAYCNNWRIIFWLMPKSSRKSMVS